jgi:hypothetical protein
VCGDCDESVAFLLDYPLGKSRGGGNLSTDSVKNQKIPQLIPMKKTLLALVLAAGLTSFAGNAKADIVFQDLNQFNNGGENIGFGFSNGIINTDLWQGIAGYQFPDRNNLNNLTVIGFQGNQNTVGNGLGSSLVDFGTTIDGNTSFKTWQSATIQLYPTVSGYLPVFFANNGGRNYGWVNVSVTRQGVSFGEAAVNTTLNEGITAGQTASVPEPSTYALFGIGALALVIAYRRKVA